jgi:ubiquinone/menaquinone biosynthesis C-methylase UbiE
MPTTLNLLGNVRGKKVLDLGCGPGIYAGILIKKGASVKGIDNSETLIKIAKKEAPEAEFTLGSAEKLPFKNSEFDIVLAALVLGHLDDWNKALKEVRRVLKKGGTFVFSNYNPVIESTVKEKWLFRKFRVIKNYFDEKWKYQWWGESTKGARAGHHHKTYGTIVKLLVKHGFEIIAYGDAKPLISAKKSYPYEYEKTLNAPHFCTWKAKKKE